MIPNKGMFVEISAEALSLMDELRDGDENVSPRALGEALLERNRGRVARDPEYGFTLGFFFAMLNEACSPEGASKD